MVTNYHSDRTVINKELKYEDSHSNRQSHQTKTQPHKNHCSLDSPIQLKKNVNIAFWETNTAILSAHTMLYTCTSLSIMECVCMCKVKTIVSDMCMF